MTIPVTMLGSWPGTDFAATQRMVLGELPELSHLVELPARGAGSGMIGRTGALLAGLSLDLQPAGWRLVDHPGIDVRRARADWRRDLDQLEEQAQGFTGALVVSLAGPWTLAASVEKPRGDKVLADHGARRDLAGALAEGAADALAEVERRIPEASVRLQLDEPLLPQVLAGKVSTASGFGRHRTVHAPEASEALRLVESTVRARLVDAQPEGAAYRSVLHCCAEGVDVDLVLGAGFDDLSIDVRHLSGAARDRLGPRLEQGNGLWLGIARTDQVDQVPRPDRLCDAALAAVQPFELGSVLADRLVLTPACGLAGWSPRAALGLLRSLREAAGLLAERLAD
ncbi:methionine synthase [Naumannella sp. ID2617S]|nr:methionine synthase [Naumannella sp. ID2617S]